MCGIVGTMRFDGRPVDREQLQRQVAGLRHRGPDGNGIWTDSRVGLGHTRLAIIDLSAAGAQPMATPGDSHVLTYNGELYNAPELRTGLRRGWRFRGHSDTEVLLYSLVDRGPACLPHLEGIFAFALYDTAACRLWLVRDPFGIKPLYYHLDRNRLVFSSEIRPLFLDPDTPRVPNHDALRQHVLFGYAPDPATAFAGIRRLPPAHLMRLEADGRATVEPYWRLESLLGAPPGDLLDRLGDSVRRQSVADVPTGMFLSGGLDSSLLLAELARTGTLTPGFRAYNVGLEEDDSVVSRAGRFERSAAVESSRQYGVDLVRIHPQGGEIATLAEILESVEEPICNPSNSLIDLICRRARERGTTVLLSGHGGDEVFGGYRRHVWARHLATLHRWGGAPLAWVMARGSRSTLTRRMAASLRSNGELHPLVSIAAMGWDLVTEGAVSQDWFPAGSIARAAAPLEELLARWRGQSFLKQMMLLDLHTYLTAQNLINMDKSSMRRSVEVRVPFLDRAVVAVGLNTPDRVLVHGLRGKGPVRALAGRLLPPRLAATPKLGFGPPQAQLVAREEYRELLLGRRTRERGLVDPAAVERLRSRLTPESENLAVQLYGLAAIEQWFRLFIDPPGPPGGGTSQQPR